MKTDLERLEAIVEGLCSSFDIFIRAIKKPEQIKYIRRDKFT